MFPTTKASCPYQDVLACLASAAFAAAAAAAVAREVVLRAAVAVARVVPAVGVPLADLAVRVSSSVAVVVEPVLRRVRPAVVVVAQVWPRVQLAAHWRRVRLVAAPSAHVFATEPLERVAPVELAEQRVVAFAPLAVRCVPAVHLVP